MKRPRARLRRLLFLAVGLLAIPVLGAAALIVDELTDVVGKSDVAIVPGNMVYPDGTPSPRLTARLNQARALHAEGRVTWVIVSGGTGAEGYDEARAMKAWLVAHGVPASAVIEDRAGVTTMATARNSAAIMKARGFKTAVVVTQYFHVPRTTMALRKAGVTVNQTSHARYVEWRDLYSVPREVVGYASYVMR